MRVLTTNSLILAAIALAPSVSAAPHTGSSVDSYESYSNLAALAQDPGPSSIPSVRRDEVISAESLYDSSPFGGVFGPVADLFKTIGMNTISNDIPLTEVQKKLLGELHGELLRAVSDVCPGLPLPVAIGNVVQDATSAAPKPDVKPLDHARSVEGRSLQDIISNIVEVPPVNTVLNPITGLLRSLGMMDGAPLNDVQEQVLSKVEKMVAEAARKVAEAGQKPKEDASTVHIEHTREEHEDCDHHDDHHAHDEQKRDSEPHGAHRNHESPDMQSEDRHTHGSDREGDHCREPRDGHWDERHEWEDCRRFNNGKGGNEGSSLLEINLGNSRHP